MGLEMVAYCIIEYQLLVQICGNKLTPIRFEANFSIIVKNLFVPVSCCEKCFVWEKKLKKK